MVGIILGKKLAKREPEVLALARRVVASSIFLIFKAISISYEGIY